MAEIEAAQHIYANLNAEQSPSGRGGFQTVFYTKAALTEDEVEEIEGRLVYFRSGQAVVKRVSFLTSTGKPAIAQIVSLAGPDSVGRQGSYLAHCFVLAPEAFAAGGARPLALAGCLPFVKSIEEALGRGNFESGDMPVASVSVPDENPGREVEAARRWPAQSLKTLSALALRSEELAQERLTVALVGEPEQVEAALWAASLGVPRALVPRCTFDTFFYRCNPIATYYWAVGLPERPGSPKYLPVDARSCQVPEGIPALGGTSYERWVAQAIDSGNLDLLGRHRDTAFALCEWLDGRAHDPSLVQQAAPAVVDSVFKANLSEVKERARARLAEQFAPVLVKSAVEGIWHRCPPMALLEGMRDGFSPGDFLEALHAAYRAGYFERPERAEVRALRDLLAASDHPVLRLVCRCWSGQWEQLRSDLAALGVDEYGRFVGSAIECQLAEPLALLVRGKTNEFVAAYLSHGGVARDGLAHLAEALADVGETAALAQFAPYVAGRPAGELRTLERIAREHPDVPESFSAAVAAALLDAPPEGVFKKVLGALGFPRNR